MTIWNHATTDLDLVKERIGYTAVSTPTKYDTPFGLLEFPGERVLFREDTGAPVGKSSDRYEIHQFGDWLIDNVTTVLDQGDVTVDRYGLLDDDAVAFVQMRFPETSRRGDVEYNTWISAVTSHNAKFATTYLTGNDVIICKNSVRAAINKAKEAGTIIRVKHTKNSGLRIQEAREALGVAFRTDEAFGDLLDDLLTVRVSAKQFDDLVESFVGKPDAGSKRGQTIAQNTRERLHSLYQDDERVSPWKGNGFGAFQAFNTWSLWERTVKGAGRDERNTLNVLSGTDASAKQAERILALA